VKFINTICSNPEKVMLPDILKIVVLHVMRARFLSGLLTRICFSQVFVIRGKKKATNSELVTLLFGDEKMAYYLSKLLYSRDPTIQALGEKPISKISSIIADARADIVLVHAHTIFSGFLSRKGFLILPIVRQTLDISGSWDAFYRRLSRGRRRDILKIKRLGYTFETTNEPKRLSFFYYKMYLPHILKRHRESAKPSAFYELKKCFRNGGLLFVKLKGKFVSGLLYGVYKNYVSNICSGIYEGKDEYYAKSGVQAARYFLIHWSRQQGHKEIDHALSNPFMNDGVFTYKREWGTKVRLNKDMIRSSVYALRLCNSGNSVMEFLTDNPFIFTDFKSLRGLVFLNSERLTEGKLGNLYRLFYTPGLSDLVVVSFLTNNASGSVFKVSPEGRILEKHSLAKGVSHSLNFLTKLAPNISCNIYLMDACSEDKFV